MCHCRNQVWTNKIATTGGRSICMSSLLRNSNLFVFCGLVGVNVERWPHLTVLSVSQRSKSWRISLVFWHVRKKVLVDLSVFPCMFHNVSNCTNQLTTKCHRNPTAAATEAFSSSSIWQHTCPNVFAPSLFFLSLNGDVREDIWVAIQVKNATTTTAHGHTIQSVWNKSARPFPIFLATEH